MTAPGTDVRRQRPRNRKQLILNAARDLLVELGYPSVTMAMIADRVGITAGALYRHFGNKADILEAVVAENFAWLSEPVDAVGFDATMESLIARIADHPYLTDLWLHEVRYLSDDSLNRLRRRMRNWQRSLAPILRELRTDLDNGQQDLLLWALASVLSCLSRASLHAPDAVRLPAVRSAIRAVTSAPLAPTGPKLDGVGARSLPVSMRERLLLAAFEQFGYRGFHDTSMATIGAAAGVTGPNLYGYFESKADILRAVHERAAHALWLGLDNVLASGGDPGELLREVARSYVRLARTWAWTLDDPIGKADLGDSFKLVQREYVDEWVALLTRSLPELEPRQARVRVQIALSVVSDMYRIPRLTFRASFQDNLVSLVLAILHDGPWATGSDK
ncbi:TetR/AcrR family transcriptional regulator [Dactylosporangium sp. CA-092794]|uniref:TetR/AcrR family transcriptional regulator n=1 Tax=Dactylosporangium sp. CA-092794 TaxID=3239929 RepID=UPI003D8AF1BE